MTWTAADLAAREAQEQSKAVVQAKATPPPQKPKTPDMPPYVEKCVRYGLALQRQKKTAQTGKTKTAEAAKPSADELVLQNIKTEDERRKCAEAVLNYYRSIQKANQTAKTS